MRRKKLFLAVLLIVTVFFAGCRQKKGTGEVKDEVLNIKVGHVGHDQKHE